MAATLAGLDPAGITTTAWPPVSAAARATAWPWLPELTASTPAARRAGSRASRALNAPLALNAPTRCRCSALATTWQPSSRSSSREVTTGVRWTRPAIRAAARSTSRMEKEVPGRRPPGESPHPAAATTALAARSASSAVTS